MNDKEVKRMTDKKNAGEKSRKKIRQNEKKTLNAQFRTVFICFNLSLL